MYLERVIDGIERTISGAGNRNDQPSLKEAHDLLESLWGAQPYILTPDAVRYCYSIVSPKAPVEAFVGGSEFCGLRWIEYRHIPGLLPGFYEREEEGEESNGQHAVLWDSRDQNEIRIWAFQDDDPVISKAMGWHTMTPSYYFHFDRATTNASVVQTEFDKRENGRFSSTDDFSEDSQSYMDWARSDALVPAVFNALMEREDNGIYEEKLWNRQTARQAKAISYKTGGHQPTAFLFPRKIKLSEIGKGHVSAVRDAAASPDNSENGPRRAHWVRGHFMHYETGKISWRKPHIRGSGLMTPIIVDR